MSSREFANTKQEELASGPLTKVEFFVLENILAFCCEEDIQTRDLCFAQINKEK